MRFERGDTFHYIDEKDALHAYPTVTYGRGGGKPPHRSRNRYNFIRPLIEDKVSAATQRVPAYEVDPSTTDPEDAGAAKMSEKVLLYGYDQWRIRQAAIDTVKLAIGMGGAGYALPYFEPNVGPYTLVDGKWVGQGEIRIRIFNGNEVYWEPGCRFETSPWWAVEQARPIDQLREMPGFVGGELKPDASTSDVPNDHRPDEQLAMSTDYFERPCPKYPRGRWLTLADRRPIVDNRLLDPTAESPWRDYPLLETDGTPVDEPLLHRLVYTHDPDSDNDFGLTWQLIDFQRTAQDCLNKMVEYKNRGLNLQMLAPVGSLIDRPDDVPNSIRYYKLSPNGEAPKWEDPPSGQILNAIIQVFNLTLEQMRSTASFEDIHADPNVAARTTAAVIEKSLARWQTFLGDLAEWHSRLARHCLLLVARYYTEPRLIDIRGRMGWEAIKDFRGAKLLGQTNVRVSPGSLEYLSKAQIQAKVQFYASFGWVDGRQAMTAIENGMAEKLTESHDLDVAKVNRILNKIRDGTIMDMPTRTELVEVPAPPPIDPMTGQPQVDPATGQPMQGEPQKVPNEVPAWMPSDFDDVPVWQRTLADWMKTEDFENSPREAQEVAKLMWEGLQQLEQKKAAEAQQQQMAQAQSLGMGNASKPQVPQPPSLPNPNGQGAPPPNVS
jgi:hypothetical protein